MTFVINGRLESLNKTLKVPRYRFSQSRRRQETIYTIGNWIRGRGVPQFVVPVRIHIHWVEKDKRRDLDNIRASVKMILDALVRTERIVNDSRKWVVALTDSYGVDKALPRIEVMIEEAATPMSDQMRDLILSSASAAPAGSEQPEGL
jgi:hypothetical protein